MASLLDKIGLVSVPHEQPPVTHSKKILIMLTGATAQMPDHKTGYFWGELLHAYEQFVAAGWDCDIVSENGTATVDEASVGAMASAGDKKKWEDKEFHLHRKLAAIRPASAVNSQDYAAAYVAGGHACCADLPQAQNLQRLMREIYEQGGAASLVCHGIALLDGLKLSNGQTLVANKQVTGFSTKAEKSMGVEDWMQKNGFKTMQTVVETNGGKWTEHSSNPMAEYVISDARLVTGMNPASAAKVATEAMAFLPKADLEKGKKADAASDKNLAQTEADKSQKTYATGTNV